MLVSVSHSMFFILSFMLLVPVFSVQSQMCDMVSEIDKERDLCEAQIENKTTGCRGIWDKITCWPSADLDEVVTIPCPKYLFYFSSDVPTRNLSKTCTEEGWTRISIDSYIKDCGYNPNNTIDDNTSGEFFDAIKVGYTIGHSVSLICLTIAIIILCLFRKLHCTRNYIHMHLFVSFILKAVAVFIKDVVLYDVGETDNCQSPVSCKAVVVFFQYGVMASYFWLLVEGLYLHTLLAVSFFSERKYFWWYILIGWGAPTIFISAWVITKAYLNDHGRLAKSTLLLIPLFGINYIIFAFIPDHIHRQIRMVFDLILGSFQGFVVAVLYCFLNGEVQAEIKRKWRRWMLQRFLGTGSKYQQPSIGSNGNNFSTQITMLTKCSPTMRRKSECQEHFSAI
ncbi:Vasoactive intestinal polypeptide receptor [Dissostichus eleginoides]|nr:Vasoactive intestinal polypeptide receptor [Dissostichus eleginoides]